MPPQRLQSWVHKNGDLLNTLLDLMPQINSLFLMTLNLGLYFYARNFSIGTEEFAFYEKLCHQVLKSFAIKAKGMSHSAHPVTNYLLTPVFMEK